MRIVLAALMALFVSGAAYAQQQQPVPRYGEEDKAKSPAQIEAASAVFAGGKSLRMPSGAGHDAQVLATIMSAGMLFVPSIGGISHHWSENTADADIVMGAEVFVEACRRLLAR